MKILERTFNLINSEGEVYSLSLSNSYAGFMYNVEGLGIEHEATYQKIGETYDLLKDTYTQGEISGVVYFKSKYPYNEYMRFALFCQDKSLRLYYRTPVGEFYRDGMVSRIEKDEGGETARATITFTATSLWYKELKMEGSNQIRYTMDSNIPAPCHLMIKPSSAVTSILWRLWDNWFQVVESGSLSNIPDSLKIATTDTLHIRSDTNPYQIYKTTSGGGKYDLYAYSDFSTKRFIKLRKGYNAISCQDAASISLEARIYYETV